jgi:hypothetical protein
MREVQDHLAEGQERPGLRIARVDLGRARAEADDLFYRLDVFLVPRIVDVLLPGHEVEVVSLDIPGPALPDGLLLRRQAA